MQTTTSDRASICQQTSINELLPWQKAGAAIMEAWRFQPNLRVSVTGRCNMNCDFCHNEGGFKHSTGLPLCDYQSLAFEAYEIGLRSVKFTGGEPMLRKDLPAIVAAFRSAGFQDISLVTNGISFTPEKQAALKSAGLQRVTVSVHTLRPEIYEKKMRVPARALQQTLINLDHASTVFAGNLKLNTVFELGGNYPREVHKLVQLACYPKATLSVLSIVSNHAEAPLISHGVRDVVQRAFHVQDIRTQFKRGFKVDTLVLQEGGAIELDDFRAEDAVAAKNSNPYCAACPVRETCQEGPYALRVTAQGSLKPCLVRNDNEVRI